MGRSHGRWLCWRRGAWRRSAPAEEGAMRSWATLLPLALATMLVGCQGSNRSAVVPGPSPAGIPVTLPLARQLSPTVVPSPALAAGSWRRVGPMAVARVSHTATLLPDGEVLVAGGSHQLGPSLAQDMASAEL